MDFNLGPMTLSVRRRDLNNVSGGMEQELDPQALAESWSPLPNLPNEALLKRVTVSSLDARNRDTAWEKLSNEGVVVIPAFMPRDTAKEIGATALALVEAATSDHSASGISTEFVIETSGRAKYREVAERDFPTLIRRDGVDEGMFDIFHFDQLEPNRGRRLRATLSGPEVSNLVKGPNRQVSFHNLNLYVNRGVTSTRMFHVDSYGGRQIKAFIYLTDVFHLDDGPYVYVLGSHRHSDFRVMNQALTKASSCFKETDAPLVMPREILPILAPAGSLIVSNQSGFHRGYPQGPNGRRVVGVLNAKVM